MDYHTLSRRQLQSLCKKHGIPANATNLEMADALSALLMPKPDTTKQSAKIASGSQELAIKTTVSKDKSLQSSQTQVQKGSGSYKKSSKKPQRATRSRGCLTEASTTATSSTENSENVEVQSTSAVQKQETKSISTRRKVGIKGEDRLPAKPAEIASIDVENPSSDRKKDRASGIVLRRGRVKVRSPRSLSKTAISDKSLKSSEVNGEGNEATEGESLVPCTQSCLLDTQKIQLRKNKRSVTFSDVLEVTHSFSESLSAEASTEDRKSCKDLAIDRESQSLVSNCEDKKVEGSGNNARRASRKDCNQGKQTVQVSQQKSSKGRGTEASKDKNIFPASKQSKGNLTTSEADTLISFPVEKTVDEEHFSQSRSRRRSVCGRKGGNEAGLELNEKEKDVENHFFTEQVPLVSNTRQSRRLTLISSDFNTAQDKGKSLEINEDEKVVDCSVQGSFDTLPISSTRRSRRLTILASDVNTNQAKTNVAESLQEKSNDDSHEGSNLIAQTKEAECDSHVGVSSRGRRRTLAPLELNNMHMNGKTVGEQMMNITTDVKNTSSVKHALDVGTEVHIAPSKDSKAKTNVRISVGTDPIKPEKRQSSENVCRSRQKNPTCPAVLSSNGKKKNSNIQNVSDREARGVRKPDAQKIVRETESEAGPAKSKVNFCETEALEATFKGEELETAIPEINEISSHSNGPENGGIQYNRSIQEDLNDLDRAAAKFCKEFEDLHASANNINSTKSSGTLFTANGKKLGQSSAEGAGISPCDTGLHGILEAVVVGNSIVTVAQNALSCSDAEISSLSSDVGSQADRLETPREHDLLFDHTSNCEHQALVNCIQEDCAASKSSPMSECTASKDSPMSDSSGSISPILAQTIESLGIISPISTRLISDEGIIGEKEAGPVEGNLGGIQSTIVNEVCAIVTSISSSDIESSLSSSIHTSLGEVIGQGNQDVSDMDVKDNPTFEEDEVAPPGLPAGSMESQHIAEEGDKHTSQSLGSSSSISAMKILDEAVTDNKDAQQWTSSNLIKTSPAEGNLGGSQFTIYDEICAMESSAERADIERSSPSLEGSCVAEVIEQGSHYTIEFGIKDSPNIEAEVIVPEGLPAGILKSPYGQNNLLELITSEEGIIDTEEILESNSLVLTNISPADANLQGHQFTNEITEHKTESNFGLKPDVNRGSGAANMSSTEDIEQCIECTTDINSPDIKSDKAVREGLSDSEMRAISPHQIAAETCAPAQEMCSGNELLVSHENECGGSPVTEDPRYDQAVQFSLCKEMRAREEQDLGFDSDFVDVIHETNERGPCEVTNFEPEVMQAMKLSLSKEGKTEHKEKFDDIMADSLQIMSEKTQFDGLSLVAGPLASSCVDVPGNTVPTEVSCKLKRRGPRAIYKSARKLKLSGLQQSGSMDSGSSGTAGCFVPWNQEEDVEVQGYCTPEMGSDGMDSSSRETSEGDSEEDSFSDGKLSKFNADVVPLNADEYASYSEENMSSDSGEDSASDSEGDDFEEEEEVLSGGESYDSEEGDTSEEELSESDGDESLDDSGSLADHESSGAVHSELKLKSPEDSSCIGHKVTEVEPNAATLLDFKVSQSDRQHTAAYGSPLISKEFTLGQRKECPSSENEINSPNVSELLPNDHNSLAVVDLQLATHITCRNDTVLTSLSFLFATPPSKIKEVVDFSSEPLPMHYRLSNDGALAENGQQSINKAENHTKSSTSLQTEQEENGEVCGVLPRGSEVLGYTDQAVNDEEYQALELTFKADHVNNEVATDDAAAETPDNICFDTLNEDLGASKNYTDTSTRTVEDGDKQPEAIFGIGAANVDFAIIAVATEDAEAESTENYEEVCSDAVSQDIGTVHDGVANDEQTEFFFGGGAANVEFTTIAVDLDLLQDIDTNKTDVAMASAIAPPASKEFGEEDTVNTEPELIELCTTIMCGLVEKAESNLCQQAEIQQELVLCDISDNSDTKLTTEVQGESNKHACEITKCRDSDVVHYVHLHESLVDETQGPCAEVEHMSEVVDELVEGVLNETQAAQCPQTPLAPHPCAEGEQMKGQTEAVYCAEIPQTSSADAEGDVKCAEVDMPLENVSKYQEKSQPQTIPAEDDLMSAPMEELLETVLIKAQVCENRFTEVIKEPAEAESSRMEISREQSLQHMDLTLMSLRKLKQMCKENDMPVPTKPMIETPSRREANAWMSAKKANTSVQLRDLPSANKRSALKALSSNIKSNTPAASARTPAPKNLQRPRNLMSTYDNNEGAGKNLVAPSPQAPPSSRREFARSVHQ